MDLKQFSGLNRKRCVEGFKHELSGWSPAEWTNAVAGEAGEACNNAKKLLRHRDAIPGNKPEDQSVTALKGKTAMELADAIIYADLAIQSLGFDTSEILREVFNAKSLQIGSDILVP